MALARRATVFYFGGEGTLNIKTPPSPLPPKGLPMASSYGILWTPNKTLLRSVLLVDRNRGGKVCAAR